MARAAGFCNPLLAVIPYPAVLTNSDARLDLRTPRGALRAKLWAFRTGPFARHARERESMSKIFEAIRKAQQDRVERAQIEPAALVPGPRSDRRRSRRWDLDVPAFVYGHSTAQEPFHEEAHTLDVSANGALLMLGARVQAGQKLLLINKSTQAEQECRVVYLGERRTQSAAVAVEFGQANAHFWQIAAR
jgi:hypothetical protein